MLDPAQLRRREKHRALVPPTLTTVTTAADGRIRITLAGELDLAGEDRLNAALRAAEADGAPEVVVDLSGLRFMDSAGAEALMALDHRLRRHRRRLTIVPGPPGVQRVLELCGRVLGDRVSGRGDG